MGNQNYTPALDGQTTVRRLVGDVLFHSNGFANPLLWKINVTYALACKLSVDNHTLKRMLQNTNVFYTNTSASLQTCA
jgi:hypothetical protein